MDFGTELEEDDISESELFEKVFKSTLKDIKDKMQVNKLVKLVWNSTKSGVKQLEKISNVFDEIEE